MASIAASDSTGKEFHIDIPSEEFHIDIPAALEAPKWHKYCCIYRVPKKLLELNKQAYTPKLISIGPLHHGNEELSDMEILKKRYFKELYSRPECQHKKEIHASIIAEKEEKIRRCYSEISPLGRKECVQMILLDAIFIIELFKRKSEGLKTDYILSKPCLLADVEHDLMLLENQLPFFILEKLYTSAFGDSSEEEQKTEETAFLGHARKFFSDYDKRKKKIKSKDIKHFTDLVRCFFEPPTKTKDTESSEEAIRNLYCATKLYEAGVKFKVHNEDGGYSLDMQFKKGEYYSRLNFLPKWIRENTQPAFLVLRKFVVDNETEWVYRNLMALEQCHYPEDAYICSNILLLDSFINSKEDVHLLVRKKVIVNWLGSDHEVASLVNKLGRDIVETHSFYSNLSEQLNTHYDNSWNRNMAALSKVYFRDIWRGTATVVGIFVLFFTFGNFLRPFLMK